MEDGSRLFTKCLGHVSRLFETSYVDCLDLAIAYYTCNKKNCTIWSHRFFLFCMKKVATLLPKSIPRQLYIIISFRHLLTKIFYFSIEILHRITKKIDSIINACTYYSWNKQIYRSIVWSGFYGKTSGSRSPLFIIVVQNQRLEQWGKSETKTRLSQTKSKQLEKLPLELK